MTASERRFDPEGKAALFSQQPPSEGFLRLECSSCSSHTRVGVVELVGLALPLSFTNPFRYHHTLLRCPACGTRTWVRIRPAR